MHRAARYFLMANSMLPVIAALVYATTPNPKSDPGVPGVNVGGFLNHLLGHMAKQDSPVNGLQPDGVRWLGSA